MSGPPLWRGPKQLTALALFIGSTYIFNDLPHLLTEIQGRQLNIVNMLFIYSNLLPCIKWVDMSDSRDYSGVDMMSSRPPSFFSRDIRYVCLGHCPDFFMMFATLLTLLASGTNSLQPRFLAALFA